MEIPISQEPVRRERTTPVSDIMQAIPEDAVKNRYAITIHKNPIEIYNFFRDFKNLPLFMKDLESVEMLSDKRSHWVIRLKNGAKAEWDAEITHLIPEQLIVWRSVDDSEIKTSGAISFQPAPQGLGTVVSLAMNYAIPGGKFAEFILQFTGEKPEWLAAINLKKMKALLETGEIPTTEGQPSGRDEDNQMFKH